MDTEAFVRWALHDSRTLEERYTTELLVEGALIAWHIRYQTGQYESWEVKAERDRQRRLNPAYEPSYSETNLRRAAEILAERTKLELNPTSYSSREIRSLAVLRYLPMLEEVSVSGFIESCEIFTELPRLRSLGFSSRACEDYRPLARCTALRGLSLGFHTHWPEVAGLDQLQLLETLSLSGNLLVLPPGTTYPHVWKSNLSCSPLHARDVRALPQLPACKILDLSGVERLDGIEAMPHLRNLTLNAAVRSFEPLAALPVLTGLSHIGDHPHDLAPLARLPRLHFLSLHTGNNIGAAPVPMRDLSPLFAAPSLREFHQRGCEPQQLEVAAINAALPPCDDLFLAPAPRPIAPVPRFIIAPHTRHPGRSPAQDGTEALAMLDVMIRRCEVRWATAYVERLITERIGHPDWGNVRSYDVTRSIHVTVECFEVLPRFPEIVEVIRGALAALREDYYCSLLVSLTVPPPKLSPAQAELEDQFRRARDHADFERRQEEQRAALERQYLLQLKQQEGEPIDPEEFAAPPREPIHIPHPAEEEEDEDEDEEDDDDGEGGVAEKKPPRPQFLAWDDEHPLADNYRLSGCIQPDEVWFSSHQADIAIHLMGREPDEEIPDEKKA